MRIIFIFIYIFAEQETNKCQIQNKKTTHERKKDIEVNKFRKCFLIV